MKGPDDIPHHNIWTVRGKWRTSLFHAQEALARPEKNPKQHGRQNENLVAGIV
jgi:hypothetical protein